MPAFDVVWNRTRLQWTRHAERAPWVIEGVLLERALIAGKPQLRIVTRLARYDEDGSKIPPSAITSGMMLARGSAGCIGCRRASATRSRRC
jgi:hypothetical protein